MLINTVLLFLSNSLVIFMVLALLISIKRKFHLPLITLYIGAIIGVFLMLLLWFFIDEITEFNDGTGLEWCYAIIHFIVFFLILHLMNTPEKIEGISHKNTSSFYAAGILAFIIMLQGTNFLIYFIGYWSQENVANALFVGVVLGAGICISISILLYFLCSFLNEGIYCRSTEVIFIFFACGLMNKASDLLLQIDFLPSTRMIYDLNFILSEKSELGHFLKALFGYDASPTILQVGLYFTALLFAFFWWQLSKTPLRILRLKEVIS
jgi:high-affinity iron transporter